jgi:hypothetical protein
MIIALNVIIIDLEIISINPKYNLSTNTIDKATIIATIPEPKNNKYFGKYPDHAIFKLSENPSTLIQ